MRVASIDIGTNTILTLIADVDSTGRLTVVRDEHAIGRLGKGVDKRRMIGPEAIERVQAVLRSHLEIASIEGAERVIAVGTSALRDAENRDEVLAHLREQCGLSVAILSGEQEAALTYRGTLAGLATASGEHVAVLDIGGGSTEVTFGTRQSITSHTSVDIGAVRLTERWWDGYPPSPEALLMAQKDLDALLRLFDADMSAARWYGVAGTPTTLAAIDLRLERFDRAAIDGHALSIAFVEKAILELSRLTLPELRSHPQIHPDRADIIVAGSMILRGVMQTFGIEEIQVSVRGLRYGVALEAGGGTSHTHT